LRALVSAAQILRGFAWRRAARGRHARCFEKVIMAHTARGAIEVGKRLYRRYSTHAVTSSAAAVSYYFLFSFFPFLLFVIALVAYLPLETPAEHFLDRVRPVLPAQAMVHSSIHSFGT
jgi:uncharacterized BrkB/YihY/UPF0761 family membrane protein